MDAPITAGTTWRLTALLSGNLLLRLAGAAGGALIGFYLADLANQGRFGELAVVGLLGVVVNLAELLGAVPFGLLADRFSARAVLVLSALLGAAATQLFGLTGRAPVFFVSRTLEGLSGAAATPALLAHLSRATQVTGRRGRVMGFFEVSLLGGLALGALVGGGLWDLIARWAFSALAAVYLVVALLFYWGAPPGRLARSAGTAPSPLAGLRHALAHPLLLRLAPAWLAANAVAGLWLTFTPFLLTLDAPAAGDQYLVGRFSASQVGLLSLGYALVFAAGLAGWGYLLDRYPGRLTRVRVMRLAVGGMFGASFWFYWLNLSHDWRPALRLVLLAPYALTIMVQSGVTPAALAYLADVADESAGRGAAMGVYALLLGVGNTLGAGLGGVLARSAYFNGLLLGTVALGVVALAALALLPDP